MLTPILNIYKYIAKINSALLMHFLKPNHAVLNAVVLKAEQVYFRLNSWLGLSCISQWHVNWTIFLKIPPTSCTAGQKGMWLNNHEFLFFFLEILHAKQYNVSSNLTYEIFFY